MANNLKNYTTLPIVENYIGLYQRFDPKTKTYDENKIEFKYSDGTSDSYVKRGYDEEVVQMMTRFESVEQSYRIMTTNTTCDFKPRDIIWIGDDKKQISKVLPLMNTNDNLRQYNFSPNLYRKMAMKLIHLK
jgi:hypothetical protein